MAQFLFKRDFVVTVGTVRIAARKEGEEDARATLRIQFKVEKSINTSEPNSADIAISNLSAETRTELQKKKLPVTIEAGYVGDLSVIYNGALTFANHTREGANVISRFQMQNGDKARINKSFKPGSTVKAMMQEVTKSLKVDTKDAVAKLAKGDFSKAADTFSNGITLSGNSVKILDDFAKKASMNFSIQDDVATFLKTDETIDNQALLLTPDNGLIGSPETGEKGIVKAKTLLQGTLKAGGLVQIKAKDISGNFRIQKIIHEGDTWGGPWYSNLELKPI